MQVSRLATHLLVLQRILRAAEHEDVPFPSNEVHRDDPPKSIMSIDLSNIKADAATDRGKPLGTWRPSYLNSGHLGEERVALAQMRVSTDHMGGDGPHKRPGKIYENNPSRNPLI